MTLKTVKLSKIDYWFLLTILAIVALVLFRVCNNDFTNWDDDLYVLNNESIKNISIENIKIFFTSFQVGLYTPLTLLSYAVDYKVYQLNPFGYHLTNLVIHLLNSALVFVLILKIVGNRWSATIVTLLFAIHPLNVETVAWISSRKDLLFSFFYLSGLIWYINYLTSKNVKLLYLTFLMFVFSSLSKPTALTFPAVLIVLDYYYYNKITLNFFLNKIHYFLISGALFASGLISALRVNPFDVEPFGYTILEKIVLALYSLGYYLFHAIFPHNLTNFHAYPYKGNNIINMEYWIGAIIVIAIISLVIKYRKKAFYYFLGIMLFFMVIGPVIRVIPSGYPIVAERYFYLASTGLFMFIVVIITAFKKHDTIKYVSIFVFLFVILAFAKINNDRISDWKNSITLWKSTIKVNPNLYFAYMKLGDAYADAGRIENAVIEYHNSLKIYEENDYVYNALGNIYFEAGNEKTAKNHFTKSIEYNPKSHISYFNRGNVYKQQGAYQEALQDYNIVLSLDSSLAPAFNNRGLVKIFLGDSIEAYKDLEKAKILQPQNKMFNDNFSRLKNLLNK
ncbi:MAG: tetratricopeptide repeat protein [Cyclobacteriaceae bacterium]|nr:tetratricopeptide repeat protein [Cyclobacteriaceae bacterium]